MAAFVLLRQTIQVLRRRPKTRHTLGPRGDGAVLPHFSNDISRLLLNNSSLVSAHGVWRETLCPTVQGGISVVKEMINWQSPAICLRELCWIDMVWGL